MDSNSLSKIYSELRIRLKEGKFKFLYLILILFLCLFVVGQLGIKNQVDWDVINYRYCNGWEFFNNRISIDIMPSTFRSYFNPIIDTITYYLVEKLNNYPKLFLLISGMKLGFYIFLSYLITNFVLNKKYICKSFFIFAILIVTALSPIVLFENNWGSTDLQIACLELLGIYIWLKTILKEKTSKNSFIIIFSAVLFGIAAGLKYPHGVFGLGILFNTIIFRKHIDRPVKSFLIIFLGLIIGFLISNGFWMFILYKHFNNPFFPYFNWIFKNSIDSTPSVFSLDFSHLWPQNMFQFIFTPLLNPSSGFVTCEFGFFDLKLHLCFLSIIAYFITIWTNNIKTEIAKIINPIYLDMLIVITIFTYYLNLFVFGQIRYVVALFPLMSLIIFPIINQLFLIRKKQLNTPLIIFTVVILFLQFGFPTNYMYKNLSVSIIIFCVFIIILFMQNRYFKDIDLSLRRQYIVTSLIILAILFSSKYVTNPKPIPDTKKIIKIEDMQIKDNANVIIGTMSSNFIVPKQNPNARYIGFAIPNDYEKAGKYYTYVKNRYAKSTYLENQLKQVFKEDKDLYFIYSEDGTYNKEDLPIYIMSIRYYSDNKIKNLKNCKSVKNEVLYNRFYNGVMICKLK